jgi:phosphatidylserine decarboxylase
MAQQVYVLRALVQVAQNSDTEHLHWWWAMILVGAMMITSVTQSVAQHHCLKIGQRVGMKLRATVAMAVFDKVFSFCLCAHSLTH